MENMYVQAGVLAIGGSSHPLLMDPDTLRLLAYPKSPNSIDSIHTLIAEKLCRNALQQYGAIEFQSGRRHYVCQFLPMGRNSQNQLDSTLLMVLQRQRKSGAALAKAEGTFRLTIREKQMVGLLMEGLTTKEMATRLRLSPNTVKSYVRGVMFKMGVAKRAAIITKVLG